MGGETRSEGRRETGQRWPEALRTLGRIYGRMEQDDKCEQALQNAAQLCLASPDKPMLFKIHRDLGVLYAKKGWRLLAVPPGQQPSEEQRAAARSYFARSGEYFTSVNARHVEALLALARGGGRARLDLPTGVEAVRDRRSLRLRGGRRRVC